MLYYDNEIQLFIEELNNKNSEELNNYFKDIPENSKMAYGYCKHIKDDDNIRKLLQDKWAFQYCLDIYNKKSFTDNDIKNKFIEVKNKIYDNEISYYYCINIEDDLEIRKNLSGRYAYEYCRYNKIDKDVTKQIGINSYENIQYTFYCMSQFKNNNIEYNFEEFFPDEYKDEYKEFCDNFLKI